MNTGIDYGTGNTNRDSNTGIRYGVIHQNEVLQAWAEISEPYYGADEEGEEIDDCAEPMSWYINDGEYIAESGNYGDIFITKSPYYTYAQFCSPCAPSACYLMNELDTPIENNRAYCFGHDWFDNGKAPYTVYSVETGEIVQPAK